MAENLRTFTDAMDAIQRKIVQMAEIAGKEIVISVESLVQQNNEKMEEVLKLDKRVDEFDEKIHSSVLQLIIIQPPLPQELKALATMMRVSREYERIGDYAVNIADTSQYLEIEENSDIYVMIHEMSQLTESMLKESIEVLKDKTITDAKSVEAKDDEVDNYFHRLRERLVLEMKQDTENIESLSNLLLVSRYLERSADHVVNVTRQVVRSRY
ncbi:MAG: phosphate signaling complex protein PhoU [Bacillus sp. (in: Bacteria)]|nr:phosphate signaling complex protein PhoU [Bacillus sp. (in: firmicutes)]